MKSIIFLNSKKKTSKLDSWISFHLPSYFLITTHLFSILPPNLLLTNNLVFISTKNHLLLHLYSLLKLIHTNNKVVKNVIFNEKKKSSSLGKLMNNVMFIIVESMVTIWKLCSSKKTNEKCVVHSSRIKVHYIKTFYHQRKSCLS